MNRLRVARKTSENKAFGRFYKPYIYFCILICFMIIVFNLHPIQYEDYENQKILYIFHDYKGNEYYLNEDVHGAASSMDYLFDTTVPEEIKGEESITYTDYVSLGGKNNDSSTKDNQTSFEEIMSDLGIETDGENKKGNDVIVINIDNQDSTQDNETFYSVTEKDGGSTLIIEKINNKEGTSNDDGKDSKTAKKFTYISEGWSLPTLLPWNEIYLEEYKENDTTYNNNSKGNDADDNKSGGITIIKDYANCTTPRGYEIEHGDSVLAYKQLDNAPDICNIERRYCRNGKLSGTYKQQGCSINSNYSYELKGEVNIPQQTTEEIKGGARQNPNGSVTVKSDEIGGGFVFDRLNKSSTEFSYSDNVRDEEAGIEQTERPHRNCTTPWGEKVKHGQVIQAFKHENGFSDAPCEAQFRLCSMGELLGTYTESTCKTWDTSFIDWVNGSPTRETYSKEKLDLIKKRIKDEETYYKNARKNATRSTNSESLDKILYILDQD